MPSPQSSVSTIAWDPGLPADQLGTHALLYLLIAALCLVLALRAMRRALAPIGQLVQAVAAAALGALAVGAALVLLTAAAISGR
jgi:hypothetical protein